MLPKVIRQGPQQIRHAVGRMPLTNSKFYAKDPSKSQYVSRQVWRAGRFEHLFIREDRSGKTCKSASLNGMRIEKHPSVGTGNVAVLAERAEKSNAPLAEQILH